MSDFTVTMENWRRMCRENSDDNFGCHDDCPLLAMGTNGCGAIYEDDFADHANWAHIEKTVDEWAEGHPEPVYPSWKEWLISAGIASETRVSVGFDKPIYNYSFDWDEAIPARIAEKLGIEPKVCNDPTKMVK